MKVILLENLKKIGTIGEIINVKRGFARNYLIANHKALYASKENIKQVGKIKTDLDKKDLEKRSYIFPSIAILNGENAVIITSLKRDIAGILKVQYIDPIDPTGNIEELEVNTFLDHRPLWTIQTALQQR